MSTTTAPIAYDRRYASYLDANNSIHPIDPGHLDRLHRGEPDATLPQMAGHHVRFAVLYVERFTSPPRIVTDSYPLLSFDAEGRVDQQHHYDALQAELDHLEANDYATPTPSAPATPTLSAPATSWTPDPITRRRIVNALRDLRRTSWRPRPPRPKRTAA